MPRPWCDIRQYNPPYNLVTTRSYEGCTIRGLPDRSRRWSSAVLIKVGVDCWLVVRTWEPLSVPGSCCGID
jgi:hypothetical protein